MRFLFWLKHSRGRILAVGWRLVLFEVFNFLFDYPLYAWAMGSLGLIQGWLVMTAFSLILCIGIFWYYDRAKVDWLFANAAREWEKETTEDSGWLRRIIVKIYKFRNGFAGILVFIVASLNIDPVIVAVHYRKSQFGGIGLRDWSILVASVTIGNIWWGAQIGLLVEILKWLVKYF